MDRTPARIALVALSAIGLLAGACAGGTTTRSEDSSAVSADPGPVHVHGLGVNPSDGALFIATHTGLFRAGRGERRATRVGDRMQDTMGFTVVGPNRFLGSGHPDLRDRLPAYLGLRRSMDAGRSWRSVSLLGRADFHVLAAQGRTVYGAGSDFRTRAEHLLSSDDGGRHWRTRALPASLIALAIAPGRPTQLLASGEDGLYASRDGGASWRAVGGRPGFLAWPSGDRLYRTEAGGRVSVSEDGGRRWRVVGDSGGEPSALAAATRDELYVALHDGTIKLSSDGGESWAIRSRP